MPEGVKDKIYQFLSQNAGKEFTAEEIAKSIGVARVAIVKAQLTRLKKEGKVEETPDRRYKAKQ
ncbi:MAG: HTH domain-containing protein [Thermoproteus sp. AZ2]|jgi:biotin operon repressor|uniref:HTH domain-containing protein n=1 Tax=Thermoproteus sp. AZ2 TaxID=1609232 RepID=A0ACC6V2H2_9CREN|nr:MAG: TrmB family transcriptional regulator [Thermoproteus sp. AZ2]